MSETLAYIDSYFSGRLSDEEKTVFETRCVTDTGFAQEVAFYITARGGVKDRLVAQKKQAFDDLYKQLSANRPADGAGISKWWPYMAGVAACLLIFMGWLLFFKTPSTQQMARQYINNNLQTLGITMGADTKDSLQAGITAYNNREYEKAAAIFKARSLHSKEAPEAIRCLGILYMVRSEYDNAIQQFDTLSAYKQLYANPALFYKAVTLMKRAAPGDRDTAHQLLQEVVNKNLSGSKQAAQWLKKWQP